DGSRGPTFPWRNGMTVARELTLRKQADGTHRLVQRPVRELASLETCVAEIKDLEAAPGENVLEGRMGNQIEIDAVLTPQEWKGKITLTYLADKYQNTKFVIDLDNNLYFADYTAGNSPRWRDTQTSMDSWYFSAAEYIKARGKSYVAPMGAAGDIQLKLLIDKTAVEVFLEDGLVTYSFCIFPDEEATELSLTAENGMTVKSLKISDMASVW
ncbi:MAG: GH32 C-terminal domain-containing protein, partial [Oscillospiraceae bacterium]|nr:GH32 C-terminal domain-containing protein [Oscillospiraceae bacterium]